LATGIRRGIPWRVASVANCTQSNGSRCGRNVPFAPKATVCNQAANLSLSANNRHMQRSKFQIIRSARRRGRAAGFHKLPCDPIPSLRSAAERGRMTWQLNLFARVCDLASDYFQDRDVAIEKISDVRVSAVGRKDDTFSKSPEFNVAYFCNLLAINLKYRCAAILAREKCIF